jgi:primosomal replication protein N
VACIGVPIAPEERGQRLKDRSVKRWDVMLFDLNKIVLSGRLSEDPRISESENGIMICYCEMAVVRRSHASAEETETDIIPIVARRSVAHKLNRYFKKGDRLTVVGALEIQENAVVLVDEIYFEK